YLPHLSAPKEMLLRCRQEIRERFRPFDKGSGEAIEPFDKGSGEAIVEKTLVSETVKLSVEREHALRGHLIEIILWRMVERFLRHEELLRRCHSINQAC